MLGDHTLGAVVQLNSGFTNNFDLKNTAAQVMYLNQAHRWNWGVVGGQIPYLSGGFASGFTSVGNEPAEVDQTILFRQTERSAAAIVAYPFNRARASRVPGGRYADIVRPDRSNDHVLSDHRRPAVRRHDDDVARESADPRDNDGGVCVRHVELRRDEPGAGTAVSDRSVAGVRFDQFHERARRLSALLHASAVLHDRDAGDALRPVRKRRGGPAAVSAVCRLSESRARIRRRDVRCG